MEVIDEITNTQKINIILNDNIKEKFGDMFIVDCLIGNTDRHNGNWGILINARSNGARFSPIYDCGSCLNPMLEDDQIKNIPEMEINNLAINCYSCIKENGKKINYVSYIKSCKNIECNEALKRIFTRINMKEIDDFIDDITCMSNSRRRFYKEIINYRYEILRSVYCKLNKA